MGRGKGQPLGRGRSHSADTDKNRPAGTDKSHYFRDMDKSHHSRDMDKRHHSRDRGTLFWGRGRLRFSQKAPQTPRAIPVWNLHSLRVSGDALKKLGRRRGIEY